MPSEASPSGSFPTLHVSLRPEAKPGLPFFSGVGNSVMVKASLLFASFLPTYSAWQIFAATASICSRM